MDSKVKQNNIIIAGGLAVIEIIAVLVLSCFFDFFVSTNDDILLRNIACGSYSGSASAYLIYIMYPLGIILSGLYKINKAVKWYEGFMILCHLVCLYIVSYKAGSKGRTLSERIFLSILSFLVFFAVDFKYIVLHQYTVLAGVIAATVVFLCYMYNTQLTLKDKKMWVDATVICLLATICLWLRKEVFFMMLPVLGIVVIYKIISADKNKKNVLICIGVPIVMVTLLALISAGIEKKAYSSDEWAEFIAYNNARTEIVDYNMLADYTDNSTFYGENGLSVYDYYSIREYDLGINEALGTDAFINIAERQKKILKEWQQFYSVPRKIIKDTILEVANECKTVNGLLVHITFLASAVYFALNKKWRTLLASFLMYGYVWIFTAYFVWKTRFPERVSYPLHLMAIMTFGALVLTECICNKKDNHLQTKKKRIGIMMVSCAIAIAIMIFNMILFLPSYKAVENNEIVWSEIKEYMSQDSDKIYLLDTKLVSTCSEKMFDDSTPETINVVRLGNWALNSPLWKEKKNNLNIEVVAEALKEKDEICILTVKETSAEWIAEFLEMDFKVVYENEKFCVLEKDE